MSVVCVCVGVGERVTEPSISRWAAYDDHQTVMILDNMA